MRIDNPSISGSLSFIGGTNSISATSVNLTGSLTGTFEGAFSGDSLTNISGAFNSVSESLALDITANASSITSLNAASSSYLLNTTDTLDGDLTVTGKITAQEFHTEFVSASIIYESGSTQFGNSADDTHIFTGNVGIGTTSPSSLLHISGSTPTVRIEGTSTNSAKIDLVGTFTTWSLENQYVNGQTNDMFRLYNSALAADAITVNRSTNNVGIGTTSPSHKLHVQGDIRQQKIVIRDDSIERYDNPTDNGAIQLNYFGFNTTTDYFRDVNIWNGKNGMIAQFDGSTNSFYVPNGSIGIGTTLPAHKLHIGTAYDDTIVLDDARSSGDTGQRFNSSIVWDAYYDQAARITLEHNDLNVTYRKLKFQVSGTTPGTYNNGIVLQQNGNVGIGTENATATLKVEGDAIITNALTVKSNGSSRALYLIQNANNAGNIIQFKDEQEQDIWELVGRENTFYIYNTNGTNYGALSINPVNNNMWINPGTSFLNDSGYNLKVSGTFNATSTAVFSGNVGIGDSSPAKQLEVKIPDTTDGVYFGQTIGGSKAGAGYSVGLAFDPEGYGNRNKVGIVVQGHPSGWSAGKMHFLNRLDIGVNGEADLSHSRMTIDYTGYIGIGSQTPQAALDVRGGAVTRVRINSNSGTNAGVLLAENGTDYWSFASTSGGNLQFFREGGGGNKMMLTSGGNLGVGTTSPVARIDTVGGIRSAGAIRSYFLGSSTVNMATVSSAVDGNLGFKIELMTQENGAYSHWTLYGSLVVRHNGSIYSDFSNFSTVSEADLQGAAGPTYTTFTFTNAGTTNGTMYLQATNTSYSVWTYITKITEVGNLTFNWQ